MCFKLQATFQQSLLKLSKYYLNKKKDTTESIEASKSLLGFVGFYQNLLGFVGFCKIR